MRTAPRTALSGSDNLSSLSLCEPRRQSSDPSFNFIHQAWHDYKVGRKLRKEGLKSAEKMISVEAKGDTNAHLTMHAEVGDKDPYVGGKVEPAVEGNVEPTMGDKVQPPVEGEVQPDPDPKTTDKKTAGPGNKRSGSEPGWTFHRDSEYPWRIERTRQGDVDWRGTWVLEVQDMFSVNWTRQKVHDGRKWRWVTLPDAPHWPVSN